MGGGGLSMGNDKYNKGAHSCTLYFYRIYKSNKTGESRSYGLLVIRYFVDQKFNRKNTICSV